MRYPVFFLIMVFLLISCSSERKEKVIPPDKMELIIEDMILAEGFSESSLNKDSTKPKNEFLSNEISKVLAVHKVTKEEYNRSFQYYIKRPDLMLHMIDSITSKAARNRDKIYNRDMRGLIEK